MFLFLNKKQKFVIVVAMVVATIMFLHTIDQTTAERRRSVSLYYKFMYVILMAIGGVWLCQDRKKRD